MARQQDLETRLKDVLDCVAQIHRREASARAQARDAQAELERLAAPGQRRLRARIGRALRRWLGAGRPAQSNRSAAAAQADASAAASFHGRDSISIPLTLEPQLVRIARAGATKLLWATALTASERARPAIDVQEIVQETVQAGDADPSPAAGIRSARLLPSRPYRLLTLAPGSDDVVVRIVRTEGNFCVLKLELLEQGSAREAELQAAAAAQARRDGNDDTARTAAILRAESGRSAAQSPAALEQQLWGGYSADALPALERLKFDPSAPPKDRASATWALMRWHFAAQDYVAALGEIGFARSLQLPSTPRLTLAQAQCLLRVGRCRETVELLQAARSPSRAADFALLESTAVRRRQLQNGGQVSDAEMLQLERINRVLGAAGLAPIEKVRAAEPLSLANIGAQARPRRERQPLKVSVVMPAFNAAASIDWALDSLLDQTWKNLEIIVVDDASDDDTAEIVAAAAAGDARVRLLRLESNGGSYRARNAGARLATGDLLMIHDADDWSHPQCIERQIDALEAYPNALGVMSHWVRVNEQLEVVGTWMPRDSVMELDFSSLMFRRELLDTLGGWDEVRVAGDAEFYSRFRAAFGEESIVTTPRSCPFAFALTREDSLTRSSATHLRSMYHGIRRNYMDAYRWWHGRLEQSTDLPMSAAQGRRAFPVPLGNRPDAAGEQRFDLVVIADYVEPCAAFDNALGMLAAASRDGRRVGALHRRHFELTNRAALHSEFYRTCLEHGVEILSAGDSLDAVLAVVASPALYAQAVTPDANVRADHVIVLVDAAPAAAGVTFFEHGSPYDARHHLIAAFGKEGRWLPTSDAAAQMMRADRRYPAPSAGHWRPIVDTVRLSGQPIRWRGGSRARPVIGRRIGGSRDWPSRRSELDLVYGAGQQWDVRFHADNAELSTLLRDAPAHWQIVPRRAVDNIEFCSDLDFYVDYPHELHADELSQGLLDAMALGVPVIVPYRYRPLLGSAATYAAAERVAETLERLWSSERDYLERAEAGRAFVTERFRSDDLLARLQSACAAEGIVVPFGRNPFVRSVS